MLPGLLFLGLACFGLPAWCRCVPLTDCPELRPPAGQRLSYDQAAALQHLKCDFVSRTIKVSGVALRIRCAEVCCEGGQPSPPEEDPTPPPAENDGTEGTPPTDLPLTCGDTISFDRPLTTSPLSAVPGQGGQLELSYECGATLVTHQHVITAAHCVRPDDLGFRSLKQANIGEWNTDTDPDCFVSPATEKNICAPPVVVRQIAAATWHPQYNTDGKYNNDIAVVRFDRPVTFGSYIQPICIPNNLDPIIPASSELNPHALAVGWGRTEALGSSPVLQEIRLPLVDMQRCNASYLGILNENQICAGGVTGEDTCSLDSGSPLVTTGRFGDKNFLIGLTSYSPLLCGRNGSFGVYTAVHKYRDWIVQTLAV
ncbi:hypothetical protein HAZT_HAZT011874 [Hyalella azteca]|uniref:Peptidase S1 domain-containing protein n=1 Tax=Hyalella azteca TaxID=294128 RepID=A0A6A0HCZ6_HYAAZ|nr:hypothetical protein HAZT_HAZT011874 [Hyalella azteca]